MKKMLFGGKAAKMNNASIDNEPVLVGICLAREQGVLENVVQGAVMQDKFIGCIRVEPELTSLTQLRHLIVTETEHKPLNFRFLTDRHWPVNNVQECALSVRDVMSVDNVVTIQSVFENARIGIRREHGPILGFIFADIKDTAVSLREHITAQLVDALCDEEFVFLDHNSWPVTQKQEIWLTVLDLIQDSVVIIRPVDQSAATTPEIPSEKLGFPPEALETPKKVNTSNSVESGISTLSHDSTSPLSSSLPQKRKLDTVEDTDHGRFQHALSFQHGSQPHSAPSLQRDPTLLSPEGVYKKQILISYVRTETALHSLQLKKELQTLGFSVFLDVDEIKTGIDWQDALNDAVMSCEVFVPLVSPRYGETQWTNREVKLADILGKFILPVNFLEEWPPRCLAIQFATTQFIPWSKPQKKRAVPPDWRKWTDEDIGYISNEIANRCIAEVKRKIEDSDDQVDGVPTLTSSSTLKSCAAAIQPPKLNKELTKKIECVRAPKPGKPLVLICCHEKERKHSEHLSGLFREQNYDVWSTVELFKPGEFPSGLTPRKPRMSLCETSKKCIFQKKANEAAVVVVLLSREFANALICHQMLFYCEHRKFLIMVQCEEFQIPTKLELLLSAETTLDFKQADFEASVLNRVRSCIDTDKEPSQSALTLSQNDKLLQEIHRKIPQSTSMVHLVGGTHPSQLTKDICKLVEEALFKESGVTVSYSAGTLWFDDIITDIASSAHPSLEDKSFINIIPHTYQEGTPQKVIVSSTNVDTVYCGYNLKQKNSIVAQLGRICLLIGQLPEDARNLLEQFVFNDVVVVPVMSSGGAVQMNQSFYEKPCGVEADDWRILQNTGAQAAQVADAVIRVVQSILGRKCGLSVLSPPVSPDTPTGSPSLLSSQELQFGDTQLLDFDL